MIYIDEIKVNETPLEVSQNDSIYYNKMLLAQKLVNLEYNKTVASYYLRYANELEKKCLEFYLDKPDDVPTFIRTNFEKLRIKADQILNCNTVYFLDRYNKAHVKDLKKTHFCKNPFCNICKKMKQAIRRWKFEPYLKQMEDKLYHMILTVPNCNGEELPDLVKTMTKAFSKLTRYLSSTKKIKGLDFKKYGYLGCLRSFEVTFHDDIYHPHYHVAIAFDDLDLNKYIVNRFSYKKFNKKDKPYKKAVYYKNGEPYSLDDYFSELEVLLQKIWWLLVNNKKVTLDNINKVPDDGYGVMIKKFSPSDYSEIFKYMTKGTAENKEDGKPVKEINYNQFLVLNSCLTKLRQIQGYGCFYNLQDIEPTEEELEVMISKYDELIKSFNETPDNITEHIEELMVTDFKIITRNKVLENERKEYINERFLQRLGVDEEKK